MNPRHLTKIIEQWAAVATATADLVELVPPAATVLAARDSPLTLHEMVSRFRGAVAKVDSAAFALFHLLDQAAARPLRTRGDLLSELGCTEEELDWALTSIRKESTK